MKAIPQASPHRIADPALALQAMSAFPNDPSDPIDATRAWRDVKPEIDRLLGLREGNTWSVSFADGCAAPFSAAQALCASVGSPDAKTFAQRVSYGFLSGAIGHTARLVEQGREMGFACDDGIARQVMEAAAILTAARFADARIARHLDAASRVLRRYELGSTIMPHSMSVEGVFSGVTYVLKVPVAPDCAHDMNLELVLEDIDADNEMETAFEVSFQGVYA